MYIGSTGPSGLHHLVYEVVDNSVDEALAGYATRIDVTLLADGGCRVVDNGRGIPVDPHPEYPDKSAAEIVLTMLHAGGKFGGEGYKISGGLHGVGVSVVNALSRRLEIEIQRDGGRYSMVVRRRRRARRPASSASATPTSTARPSRSGPTPRSWKRSSSAPRRCVERLREMAFLNKSLEIVFRDERVDPPTEQIFKYDGGIVDFVTHLNASKEPLFATVIDISDTYDSGEVEIALQWNTGFYEGLHSFANNIATTEGGMHEEGFKKSLTNVVNRYARGQGPPQGEGREPPRRGHPRGSHRDRLGEAAQPAVRGADQDQARQHRDPFVRRARHQREARGVARGAPDRGQGDRHEVDAGRATRAWPRARRATSRGASRCSSRRSCRASSPTARRATPKRRSCSSSRVTAPAAAPRRRATRASRRSCRSAARS